MATQGSRIPELLIFINHLGRKVSSLAVAIGVGVGVALKTRASANTASWARVDVASEQQMV